MMKSIFSIFMCSILLLFFSGCDEDMSGMNFYFGQPPRIIYIANVDTELDFSNATLLPICDNGIPGRETLWFPLDRVIINHSIDFTTPGIYYVEVIYDIGRNQFPVANFFIQVIDEDSFEQLKKSLQ